MMRVLRKPSLSASGPIISCAPGPISARGNGWNSLIGNGLSSSSTCILGLLRVELLDACERRSVAPRGTDEDRETGRAGPPGAARWWGRTSPPGQVAARPAEGCASGADANSVWSTRSTRQIPGSGAAMTDPVETPTETDTPASELAETALVEEVSIDGMCGVY